MKFFNIFYNKIIILSIASFLNFSNSNEILNFQCLIDIITKNGGHTITTASIISSEYLVTSASSVDVDGLKSLIITCCDENSFLIKPKNNNIIIHPKFQHDTGLNNLALIRVPKKRLKSACIKPIALPCNFGDDYLQYKEAITTTWITNVNDVLKELPKIKIVPAQIQYNGLCYKFFKEKLKYPYNEMNMCIQLKNSNRTECSPSHPIVIKNCQNQYTLAGITIYTLPDCTGPIAAIKLSAFYEWIEKVTKKKISKCTPIDCDDLQCEIGSMSGFNDAMFYFLTMC